MLLMRQSNFKTKRRFKLPISRLRDFTRSYDETSYQIFKRYHGSNITFIDSGADNCNNRSNYDTSNRFGTNTLWGSLFKKKTRATQNFNMAATFQDGRHGILWNVIFCLKMSWNGRKRLFWQQSVYFEHANCTVNVTNTIQMFILFQYGRQFPRWSPLAIV